MYSYYICHNTRNHTCKNKNVNKDFIEKLILDEIAEKILSDEVIEKIAEEAVKHTKKEIEKPKVSVKELEKQERSIERKMEKLMDLYVDEVIDKITLNKKADKMKEELQNVQREKRKAIQLESAPTLTKDDFVNYIKSYRLDTSDEEVVKALIDTFVEKVIVYNDRFDVTFKIDFDTIGGTGIRKSGYMMRSTGAYFTLPPIKFTHSYSRNILTKMKRGNDNIINYNNARLNHE